MTDPMPLDVAARLCFPHGGATKRTLLDAIRKGALGFERVGNRYLTTVADIEAWRKQCRNEARGRVSTSTPASAARAVNTFEKAKEALRPFARIAKNWEPKGTDPKPSDACLVPDYLTMGDLRHAAAVLKEMEDEG